MKVYVSLTSIYQNQNILIKTLQSITNQTKLPDKCYIYLSEKPYLLDTGFQNKLISTELQKFLEENNLFEISILKLVRVRL